MHIMVDSLRRIFSALLIVAAVIFGVSTASSDFSLCSNATQCIANVSSYDAKVVSIAGPTTPQTSFTLIALNETLRTVSAEALCLLLFGILVLEVAKPHFFTVLFKRLSPAR